MDTIFLQNIQLECILGCFPEERTHKRPVSVSVTLFTDTSLAARRDNLADAIDYDALVKQLRGAAEASSFNLIEALAERLSAICLDFPKVEKVRLAVSKPHPCPGLEQAVVTIERQR